MKHHLFTASLLGLGLLAAAPRSHAQSADRKWGVSGYTSVLRYRGDLGNNYFNRLNLTFGGGLTVSRYLGKGVDINLSANQATLRYPSAPGTAIYGNRFYANVSSFGLGFKLKLNNGWALKEDAVIQPYILLQPGYTYIYTNRFLNNATTSSNTNYGAFDAQGAVGLNFRLTPGLGLFVQAGQHLIFRDDDRLDGIAGSRNGWFNKYDQYLQYSAGLTANLGKAKDTDGDGVPDRKDKCPDTPAGVKVDLVGCPLDTDGDGVADYLDKCPDVKGLAALQGCPDADGDGVADADDKCPNTPAGVKVDASGCSLDRDGDGVPDYQDKCPDRAGPASNKGCPEIKAEQKKILNEYPDYSLSIAGHTDSKGDDNYNLRLSYERAASARKYMVSKGIPAERIESRGYGETKPIADNKTAAGQALNRRVDFDPYLTGEANAAEVKYGPAPTISELRAAGKPLPGKKTIGTGAPRSRMAPVKKAPVKKAPAKRK